MLAAFVFRVRSVRSGKTQQVVQFGLPSAQFLLLLVELHHLSDAVQRQRETELNRRLRISLLEREVLHERLKWFSLELNRLEVREEYRRVQTLLLEILASLSSKS